MRKIMVFSLFFYACLFIGCASFGGTNFWTNYEEVNVLEVLGPKYKDLQGLVFYIHSGGNVYMNSSKVRTYALRRAATICYDKGYQYFTIISEDNGSKQRFYTTLDSSSRTAVSYTKSKYKTDIYIMLVTEEEFEYLENVYEAAKYIPADYKPKNGE
ncbi:hypothetical protein PilKf_01295 [Pillotina sp. SPG140]|jgi:hypothetical protein